MEVVQTPEEPRSSGPLTFIMETFPHEHSQGIQQDESQTAMQLDMPQLDVNVVESQPPLSEFSQELYSEATARRIQPPRARRTDFGKHNADDLIIDAIERAGTCFIIVRSF